MPTTKQQLRFARDHPVLAFGIPLVAMSLLGLVIEAMFRWTLGWQGSSLFPVGLGTGMGMTLLVLGQGMSSSQMPADASSADRPAKPI